MAPKPRDPDRLEIMQGTLDLIILRTLRWGPHARPRHRQIHRANLRRHFQNRARLTLPRTPAPPPGKVDHRVLGHLHKNRRARFYSLTAAGRRQLNAEHSKWERFSEAVARILTSPRAEEDV